MTLPIRAVLTAVLLAGVSLLPTARAAESYDSCTAFITALPAVIGTQGTWCMNKDLATAMTSGVAISVQANNVTIDCNGFKLGGLAAGPLSTTRGIESEGRANITVRDCNVRGFAVGIYCDGAYSGMVGNAVMRMAAPYVTCVDMGHNVSD